MSTEGVLRASHRKSGQAPYDNLGLPFQSHYQSDVQPIPASAPILLNFHLLPTSYKFRRGNRLRITITFADADNFVTPVIAPAPLVKMLRNARHPSFVDLPVIYPDRSR